jgi:outer membrane immunogenic protein
MKAPPPPPIPIFSWTGCYIGGHVGGLFVNRDFEFRDHNVDVEFHENLGDHDVDGFVFGVQGGCDYQFGGYGPGGGFVIGINAQWSFADADGEHDHFFRFENEHHRFHSEIESVGSVSVRLGWAVDRFLIYVKGGVAWEEDKFHVRHHLCPDPVFCNEWHHDDTRTGFVVGVGAEFAFTNWVSAFVEGNFYQFDDDDRRFNHTVVCDFCDPFDHHFKIDEQKFIVKGGINLRFGGWGAAPVAARY